MMLLHGDCLEQMKQLADNSVDSVVTDPPYGLSFMGKKWDYDVPSVEVWREVLRVLKPGGHLLSFGGTRTYHRLVINIEDAGFEIRDQIQWIYGSGFPKSLDISKAIDKAAGVEREVVGLNPNHRLGESLGKDPGVAMLGQPHTGSGSITTPSTDLAKKWQGWGTALKPANEPIVLARKPLIGTVAKNVEQYGTGGLNIDECRVESKPRKTGTIANNDRPTGSGCSLVGSSKNRQAEYDLKDQGRWPANILFDEEAAEMLDEQTANLHGAGSARKAIRECGGTDSKFGMGAGDGHRFGDSGGASRFFYCAKASKSERNAGLEGMPEKEPPGSKRSTPAEGRMSALGAPRANHHPTVKPIKLMQYLIKLITPPNGTVLDPFMGSGSTGVAAKSLGFEFIGIEMNEEYLEIAKRRTIYSAEISA
jgi:site-specific DNA-methyltransferase (adenine-specific)